MVLAVDGSPIHTQTLHRKLEIYKVIYFKEKKSKAKNQEKNTDYKLYATYLHYCLCVNKGWVEEGLLTSTTSWWQHAKRAKVPPSPYQC